uniref:Uncharacterized protein n=1 Tax=viral metagenome TaxID=1070528 RepID=A0A6M3IM62_9ZZZZ
MSKKKIPDWIKLKYDVQPPVFECERCGVTRELHLPAAIDDALKQGQAFAESHKFCQEK